MLNEPLFAGSPCQEPASTREAIARRFAEALAGKYSPSELTKAGVFTYVPLHGGIFKRREKISYLILHSTETGKPADAPTIVRSWNNKGLRHAGSQFIVDRDGKIYITVDPKFATVHVESANCLFGVNNDNSIGIEQVRSGDQPWTVAQMSAVEHLAAYLEQHYRIQDDRVLAHGWVQPKDRSDPVGFDWTGFRAATAALQADRQADQIALAHRTSN